MRLVFICMECQVHYLPPEGMRYGDGSAASPVWCSPCQVVMASRGVEEPKAAAAVAMLAAMQALNGVLAARERSGHDAPTDSRPSRPSRTRRARPGPAGGRTKLR